MYDFAAKIQQKKYLDEAGTKWAKVNNKDTRLFC